jgi:hypothetical protein
MLDRSKTHKLEIYSVPGIIKVGLLFVLIQPENNCLSSGIVCPLLVTLPSKVFVPILGIASCIVVPYLKGDG